MTPQQRREAGVRAQRVEVGVLGQPGPAMGGRTRHGALEDVEGDVSVADHGERVHTCGMKLPRIVAVAAAASVLLVGIAGCAT